VGPNKRVRHFTYSLQVCTSLAADVLYRTGCMIRNLDEKHDYSRECDHMVIPFNNFKTIFDFSELLCLIYGKNMYCYLIISMANSRFKYESVLKTVKKSCISIHMPVNNKTEKIVYFYIRTFLPLIYMTPAFILFTPSTLVGVRIQKDILLVSG
jgi:hypothetical protein